VSIAITIDPDLAEPAVWLAAERASGCSFHQERETLYAIEDPERRNRAFVELHHRWFDCFGLERALADVLAAHPLIVSSVAACAVRKARRARDQGAELFVRPGPADGDARRLTLSLLPETLVDPTLLTPLLDHELLHVDDMLDPSFGYLPELPWDGLPGKLAQQRYTALWAATVAMRLGSESSGRCRAELLRRLPDLEGTAMLSRLLSAERPSHEELVAVATAATAYARRCPLCHMPTHDLAPVADTALERHIRHERPAWDGASVCVQCAELYRARLDEARGEQDTL